MVADSLTVVLPELVAHLAQLGREQRIEHVRIARVPAFRIDVLRDESEILDERDGEIPLAWYPSKRGQVRAQSTRMQVTRAYLHPEPACWKRGTASCAIRASRRQYPAPALRTSSLSKGGRRRTGSSAHEHSQREHPA